MKAIATALTTLLTGDATLMALATGGVHSQRVPQDTSPPYVVFAQQTGLDHYSFAKRAWEERFYLVRGITKGSDADSADDIAARIDLILNDATLTVAGYTNIVCRRVQPIEYPESPDGVEYHHAGGIYRIGVAA